jgi:hypothetical protein
MLLVCCKYEVGNEWGGIFFLISDDEFPDCIMRDSYIKEIWEI